MVRTLSFVLTFFLSVAVLAAPKKSEAEIVRDLQLYFEKCIADTYLARKTPWQEAVSLCNTAFNIAFEDRDTVFAVVQSRADGPQTYFYELRIVRHGRTHSLKHFYGTDGENCAPAAGIAAASAPLQTFTEEAVTCEDPEETRRQGGISVGGMKVSRNGRYGYGFYRLGDGCQRLCPQGQVFVGPAKQCMSCASYVSTVLATSNVYSSEYSESFTETDDTTNTCRNRNGCEPHESYYGKKADGKPDCRRECLQPGAVAGQNGSCEVDPKYCERKARELEGKIYWDNLSQFGSTAVGKCSASQVREHATAYQSIILNRLGDFMNICKKKLKEIAEPSQIQDPYLQGPGDIRSYLRKNCGLSKADKMPNVPGFPLFGNGEAKKAMELIAGPDFFGSRH